LSGDRASCPVQSIHLSTSRQMHQRGLPRFASLPRIQRS
jgi:hypothetical protein